MFQTTLLDEYERAWHWAELDIEQVRDLCRNSISHSFAAPDQKAAWLKDLATI